MSKKAGSKQGSANDLATAEHYFRSGQVQLAEVVLRQVLERDPKSSRACELMAYIHGNRGDLAGCEALLRQACSLAGASPEAFFYLGRVQLGRQQARDAVQSFERTIELAGPSFEALHELGVAWSKLGEHRHALDAFERAGRQRPSSADLQFNIGRTLEELHRFEPAVAAYDRALQLEPRQPAVWATRGVALMELQRAADALASFDRALALAPDDVDALLNKAAALKHLKRRGEALACYERALQLAPETPDLKGEWLQTRMQLCHWEGLDAALADLLPRAARGERVSAPFPMLATPADSATLLAACRAYALDKYPPMEREVQAAQEGLADARPAVNNGAGVAAAGDGNGTGNPKIRLGYFSSDFHDHATSQLMARVFECHDRARFELIAFSFGPQVQDAMRERVERAFDRFIDVSAKGDAEVAAEARELGIDIAIDLKGFTTHARTGIFARRAAPIQVSYLGFPGTMGCDYIDYLIADASLIRPGDGQHYSEKIALLPDCYQANDDSKQIAGAVPSREQLGLPAEGFVFCCFNSNYKITPAAFDIWMRLLQRVAGSVLWLYRGDEEAARRLQAEAQARGIDPERLVWAEHAALPEHLARHACADLFLDTFDYNAHTTSSDALWAGLPVLTLEGATFASRVGASLLRAVGLPELVCGNADEYEAKAFELATSPQSLAATRQRLGELRTSSPLFDSRLFTRRLEAAFATMHDRRRQGLAPADFAVPD